MWTNIRVERSGLLLHRTKSPASTAPVTRRHYRYLNLSYRHRRSASANWSVLQHPVPTCLQTWPRYLCGLIKHWWPINIHTPTTNTTRHWIIVNHPQHTIEYTAQYNYNEHNTIHSQLTLECAWKRGVAIAVNSEGYPYRSLSTLQTILPFN